jgi:hypothetical protein
MRPVDFPLGLVTSVGSVPHRSPEAAVQFVLEHQPELPAAPTIPATSPLEGMLAQAAWGIPGVTVRPDGRLDVDRAALDPAAILTDPLLLGPPFTTFQVFLQSVAGRSLPVKLQLTGPVTLGLALETAGVESELAFRVAAEAVRQRAGHLLDLARREAPGVPLVVFVDEPGLVVDARSEFPLSPDETIDLVSGALAALEPHAITGVHCCGAADWRAVLQAGPQVLSLPVDEAGIHNTSGPLATFLDRGGWIAWGAVPTDGPIGDRASGLWRRLSTLWCELVQAGCDPVALRRQAMITPACGLGMHTEGQAERILLLSREIGERLHDQLLGVRLSVGA